MTPTLAIATTAVVILLSTSGAAAKRRRIGSGSGSYCVDDRNQRVSCGASTAAIIGAVIGGVGSLGYLDSHYFLTLPFPLVLLTILLCVCLALWRRRRSRRAALLPTTAATGHHQEKSTIASESTLPNMEDPMVHPAPAHMGFPYPETYDHSAGPTAVPVGMYTAPQGPPPATWVPSRA
jgi:uncharacterized membrane protein YfcA